MDYYFNSLYQYMSFHSALSIAKYHLFIALLRDNWHTINCTYLNCNLVSFDVCLHWCNHHHNHANELFQKFLLPFVIPPTFLLTLIHRPLLRCLLSLELRHFLEFYANENHSLYFLRGARGLASLTCPCCCMYHTSFLFIAE